MTKIENKSINDLKFVITESMKVTTINMLVKQQMLDEMELTPKERKLLEKELAKLRYNFAKELQEQNPVQTQIVRTYLSSKKEIDK